jgi:methanogenic corrinoid protein MtbC1
MLASVLENSARALARYATIKLLELRPEARQREPTAPFAGWEGVFAGLIEDLAAAANSRERQLLVDQVRWTAAMLAGRGVPNSLFRAAVQAMKASLASELPSQLVPLAIGYLDEALAYLSDDAETLSSGLSVDADYGRAIAEYLLAILEGDRERATRIVLDHAERGHTVSDLILRLVLPAQEELGRMWVAGEINVAEEHFATATTRTILARLHAYADRRPPHGKTLLAAAVAGDQHDLGVQVVSDFFERDGWRVICLGSDMPADDLVQAIHFFRPDLVALAATLPTQLSTLRSTIAAVRRTQRGWSVRILVGGNALTGRSHLAAEIGSDGYAANPIQAVALGRELVGLGGDRQSGSVISQRSDHAE